MNLLLVWPSELEEQSAWIDGRRADHLLGLLAKAPGDRVRVGVVGQGVCEATVVAIERTPARVQLELGPRRLLSRPTTSLILALPRPKALSRIVQLAASLGTVHVDLVAARKVDGAYFSSPRLAPARLDEDALLGLEQGCLVHPPTFRVHRSLARFVEQLGAPTPHERRVLFDPSGQHHLAQVLDGASRSGTEGTKVTLAFGPDGGFMAEEVEAFRHAGFSLASLSASTLRTEVAVAVGLGQLELVRKLG